MTEHQLRLERARSDGTFISSYVQMPSVMLGLDELEKSLFDYKLYLEVGYSTLQKISAETKEFKRLLQRLGSIIENGERLTERITNEPDSQRAHVNSVITTPHLCGNGV